MSYRPYNKIVAEIIPHQLDHLDYSQISSIRQIQSLYYKQGNSQNSSINHSHSQSSISNPHSKNDSLKYSHTTDKQNALIRNQKHQIRSVTIQQFQTPIPPRQTQLKSRTNQNVQQFLLQHRTWVPRPPFDPAALWSPAYRRLGQIRRQIQQRIARGNFWKIEKEVVSPFYRIPEDALQVITQSTDECNKFSFSKSEIKESDKNKSIQQISQNSQISQQRSEDISNNQNLNKKQMSRIELFSSGLLSKNRKKGAESRSLINKISQSKFQYEKERSQSIQKTNKMNEQSFVSIPIKDLTFNSDLFSMIKQKSYHEQELSKMSYNQLTQQIAKHLKILQGINKSIIIQTQTPKESFIQANQQQNYTPKKLKQRILSNQHKIEIDNESQYFKSIENDQPLSLSKKKSIFNMFNEQQLMMMNKMVRSMMLFHKMGANVKQVQSKVGFNQRNNSSSSNQETLLLDSNIDLNKFSKSSASIPTKKSKRVTFKDQICEKQPQNNVQFRKLEQLMKDRQMKESILDSLGLNSSENNNSFLSIIDRDYLDQRSTKNQKILIKHL